MLGIEGEGLAQLLCDPEAGRMCRDVEMQDAPAVMGDDKEAVQHSEREGWNRKEVHGCDGFSVIQQEGLPAPGGLRVLRCPCYPARNGSLRDVEP